MSARKRNRELALTRALISRAHSSAIADDPDAMRLRSEEELKAGLDHVLKEHRADDGLWLFAYGSLMWKPEIEVAERRVATVRGWHRCFCLWQWRFRGTRDCPGVMLALDRGGSCVGIVYNVTGPDLPSKIMPVWQREMRGNGYLARWVSAITAEGPVRDDFRGEQGKRALRWPPLRSGDRGLHRYRVRADRPERRVSPEHARCEELGVHNPYLWRMQAERMSAEEQL